MSRRLVVVPLVAAIGATVLVAPASAAPPQCFGRAATIVGTEGPDSLEGTEGDDVIVGRGGLDSVEAYGGNDRICLSDGEPQDPQTVRAGGGADRIRLGTGASNVYGEGGRDLVYAGPGEDFVDGGKMGDRLFGEGGMDSLHGEGGHDVLRAGDGDDLVHGYDGDDTLDGGPGMDKVFFTELCCEYSYDSGGVRVDLREGTAKARDGSDTVHHFEYLYGSKGRDRIEGSSRGETIEALEGDDVVEGGGGKDLLIPDPWFGVDADAGNDVVRGGAGRDTIRYVGYEKIKINLAKGTAAGARMGSDRVGGIEDIIGTWGPDVLIGNGRDNYILGDAVGGARNDYLDGRGGVDTLDGGPGPRDKCVRGEKLERCEVE